MFQIHRGTLPPRSTPTPMHASPRGPHLLNSKGPKRLATRAAVGSKSSPQTYLRGPLFRDLSAKAALPRHSPVASSFLSPSLGKKNKQVFFPLLHSIKKKKKKGRTVASCQGLSSSNQNIYKIVRQKKFHSGSLCDLLLCTD